MRRNDLRYRKNVEKFNDYVKLRNLSECQIPMDSQPVFIDNVSLWQRCINCFNLCSREVPTDNSFIGYKAQSLTQVTTVFNDIHTDDKVLTKTNFDYSSNDIVHPLQDLNDFLRRPISLRKINWSTSEVVGFTDSFYPWKEFLNDASVKKRIDNYAFLRGNLHVKAVVTASPFWYGATRLAYIPCFDLRPLSCGAADDDTTLIPKSQLPGEWIYPQDCKGADIVLPFIFHKNWINLATEDEAQSLGRMDFIVYAPLTNSNGLDAGSVDIEIYAWMDEVEIAAPTVGWSLQSQISVGRVRPAYGNKLGGPGLNTESEYDGFISGPASALAKFAERASMAPVVAPYALATQMIATGVRDLSKLFGYTNVPNLSNVEPVMNKGAPNQATTDISVPFEKLSVDSKNELTIDSRIVGHSGKDELDLASLIERESYLTSFSFSTDDANDDMLFSTLVGPMNCDTYTIAGDTPVVAYNSIPLSYISTHFKYWRGPMVYRFKFICSKFHKGRLRITFDPAGDAVHNVYNDANTTNVAFTRIVDLSTETDVEIEVPYMQSTYWQKCVNYGVHHFSNQSVVFVDPGTHYNGSLTVRVLNPLSAPVADSSVYVLVSARAGSGFQLAAPLETIRTNKLWVPQSDVTTEQIDSSAAKVDIVNMPVAPDNQLNLVTMGEKIVSLRQLLHRTVYIDTLTGLTNVTASSNLTNLRIVHGRLPPKSGFDPLGFNLAEGILAVADVPYNFVSNNLFSDIIEMFLGYRGSVNWSYFPRSQGLTASFEPKQKIRVSRYPGVRSAALNGHIMDVARTSADAMARASVAMNMSGDTGSALAPSIVQPMALVNIPYYNMYNMSYANKANDRLGSTIDESDEDSIVVDVDAASPGTNMGQRILVDRYFCTGPDFNLMVFLCTPTIYVYSDPASSA